MKSLVTSRQELQGAILETLSPDNGHSPISQNELAKKMEVSAATIITVKKGEWHNISESMFRKMRAYFKLDDWGLRSTYNLSVITALCDDATKNKRFLAVAGYTGAGKTTALEHHAMRNASAYYVLAKAYHKPRSFLQAIQRAMGISEGNSIAEIMQRITNKMLNTPDCLLIVDDAGKLTSDCMRMMQCIFDDTKGQVGIVMAGTEYLKTYIDSQAKINVRGFRELKRRIAYWQPLAKPTRKEVAVMCNDYGIVDRKAVSYVFDNANEYETLKNLILDATKVASREGQTVTREVLSDLQLGDHAYEFQKG